MNYEYGAFVEWYWQANEELLGKKHVSHFFHHKSHVDYPGIQPGSPQLDASVSTALFM